MTLGEALAAATDRLRRAGIEGAARDAQRLVAHATGLDALRLTLERDMAVAKDASARLDGYLARREAREPVSKILGHRAFWGRDFAVTPDVLDPRPETESLIALALEGGPAARVLDLGTGSGILAVTLAAEWTQARVMATDLSPPALEVARANAATHGVGGRVSFAVSDWFDRVNGVFELIVSNPPYIAASEMPSLAPEVLGFDPHLALSPGGDGLGPYRAIAAGAGAHLAPGGRLLVEIGHRQGPAVAGIFTEAGLEDVRVHPDMDNRDRVVSARHGAS
ncbi:peptide chain release factor N(5)-glutamine methyltransferase [Maritimibacter sp. UBA3975]|uniref:peptide chain release factor N(5)-glutamine methyltransferase n=1 Tax=Maritimibacter sp. UBA3975 TaxID=1946833 RepID=UPI000C0B35DF|nr:peptide chain release factor N(5)-glutamine methyltransferase [Maritimibacter sp. UBA3975]MAM60604.1 protein-(glutamine-N5) methyltransferase, release factor-specific [Maritimibacter sp.]|tara:strand:+ start:23662 stop:24501 length:840 start_codon:yes stop_codon:yes gene_type:complete